MSITRKHTWQGDLHDFVMSRAEAPFAWGSNDCALFVSDAIEAITGTDVAGEFRGKYSDEAGALARIREVTGGSSVENVADHVTAAQGMAELPSPLYAQRGDVVIFDGSEGPGLGIVHLNGIHALFVTPTGLRRIAVRNCRRAWRVGEI